MANDASSILLETKPENPQLRPSYGSCETAPGVHVDHLIFWEYCTCLHVRLLMIDMYEII